MTCAACVVGCSTAARADEPPVRELRYDTVADVSITATGGTLWIASELLKGQLAPSSCRWCSPPGIDSSARDALRWSSTGAADTASYVSAFALAPLAAFGLDAIAASDAGHARAFWVDALVIGEASVLAVDANQLVKFVVGRERPFVHALAPDQKGSTAQPSDNDLSFFSGHTTVAFALASSAGTVASMRGYRLAPVIWGVGMTLAVASGYLRMAADRHWLTDVVTGAVVGGGMGFAIPFVFHRPRARTSSPSIEGLGTAPALGAGSVVTVSGTW